MNHCDKTTPSNRQINITVTNSKIVGSQVSFKNHH